MIHEFGDFEAPAAYENSEEAQASYQEALAGVRTATPEQMEAWKAAYVANLVPAVAE